MLLAAVFDDQAKAHEGTRALHAFHSGGVITVYTHALLERDRRRGVLSVREPFHEGMVAAAPAAAALVGALVSLAGGPMTAAMLTLESGLVGTVRDVIEAGLDPAFFEEVAAKLRPGSFGLVAEVELEETVPLESRMVSLSGRMAFQKGHGVRLEELMLREAEALRRSHSRLFAPQDVDDASGNAMRQASVAELRRAVQRARQHASALRREALAKVAVLRAQAALIDGPARQQIEARAGRVRTEWEERAQRLDRLIEDIGHLLPPGQGGRRH
jgi:uncharacterized membrane protein